MKYLSSFLFIALVLSSCNQQKKMEATGFTQGTTYSITYYSDGVSLQYQIDSLLIQFDRVLSTYQPNSYITKWNENENIEAEMPALFKNVVTKALDITQQTNGAFDISVKPIFSFWFDSNWDTANLDSSVVDSIMHFVGSGHLTMTEKTLVKDDPRVQLDVNAIAQGYSVDVVCRYLESQNIYNYLVEIGGEVRVKGTKDDDTVWRVGIERPNNDASAERSIQMSLPLKSKALATSGNYRKYLEVDGEKLGHVLNPLTGYPAQTDVLSASIVADDCITADAIATACLVLKFNGAKALIESENNLEGILIYSEAGQIKTWVSKGLVD
ncbi:FAD:protein FMN transferase [Bacteroidota bacterium]